MHCNKSEQVRVLAGLDPVASASSSWIRQALHGSQGLYTGEIDEQFVSTLLYFCMVCWVFHLMSASIRMYRTTMMMLLSF